MLYDPSRHEPLAGGPWNPERVRQAIQAIVDDAGARFDPERLWPLHPLDREGDEAAPPLKCLYFGAAGTLWALWQLEQCGAATSSWDPRTAIERVYEAYLAEPDTLEAVPSYWLGQVGILLILWRMTGSSRAPDLLETQIRANIPNPTLEALWAAPGTMLGAWRMWTWTGEERWRALYLENVEEVWRTWQYLEKARCYLWTQDLYGQVAPLLGAGHGFAGNVYALLEGASLLSDERRQTLFDRCLETLRATARIEGACANWPPGIGPSPGHSKVLAQWCHGAPGMVTGLSPMAAGERPELDALLVKAGELIWQAGPLEKGPGLCHGTAGNGYALLKLYKRTGDARWLERARLFAMHALEQSEAMRARHQQGRYSLWTGDAGLAIYLWHCLVGEDAMPCLDAL